MKWYPRMNLTTRDDVAKSITGGTSFAIVLTVVLLIVYMIVTQGANT